MKSSYFKTPFRTSAKNTIDGVKHRHKHYKWSVLNLVGLVSLWVSYPQNAHDKTLWTHEIPMNALWHESMRPVKINSLL